MKQDFDFCIIGSGFCGIIIAHALKKIGYSCIILEKQKQKLIMSDSRSFVLSYGSGLWLKKMLQQRNLQASLGGAETDRGRGGDRDLVFWFCWSSLWTALLIASAANLLYVSCSSAARSAFSSSDLQSLQSLQLGVGLELG